MGIQEINAGQREGDRDKFSEMMFYFILLTLSSQAFSSQFRDEVAPSVSSSNDLSCSLCKTVMELLDAYITDGATEQQIADALKQICSVLPSPLDIECEVMITEYTDDIIELIINQYMRPDQVCEALSLCP